MKIGTTELQFTPASVLGRPRVLVALQSFGMTLGTANMTPDQARQMAAEITLAADLAEGKTP